MTSKPIVLIADDEQTNIDVVSSILADKYDLRVAHNGERTLQAMKRIDVDLLLLDIQMPKKNGFEVAKELRLQHKYDHIPIIFLTSQKDEDSIIKGFDLGGNDYITKPFNPKELLARVQTHLHVHQFQKFLEMMLNLQSNIVVLLEGDDLLFLNKTGLEFFGVTNKKEFLNKFNNIWTTFLDETDCFHHSAKSKTNWVYEIQKLPVNERNVTICSQDGELKTFSVSLRSVTNSSMFIIDFHDITDSLQQQKELEEKVVHDTLTGTYNREYFVQNISRIAKVDRRDDELKAVAFLDIDFFKNINDTYGHDTGDNVLKKFVEVIQENSRQSDILIRWGGEEFILILTIPDLSLLETVLEKIRLAVQNYSFISVETMTCSIGATLIAKDEDINESIKRADAALYQSKNLGRNKTTIL